MKKVLIIKNTVYEALVPGGENASIEDILSREKYFSVRQISTLPLQITESPGEARSLLENVERWLLEIGAERMERQENSSHEIEISCRLNNVKITVIGPWGWMSGTVDLGIYPRGEESKFWYDCDLKEIQEKVAHYAGKR